MKQHDWQSQIDELIEITSLQKFRQFRKGIDTGDESGLAAELYHLVIIIGLTEALFERVMTLPDSDLSSIPADLDRLWQAALTKRDSSMLASERDLEEDEALVEQLERLQNEADGILAVLEAYADDEAPLDKDINALYRQVMNLADSSLHEARRVFGQAGAAALRGAHVWPLWRTESDRPLVAHWFNGFATLREMRKDRGEFPLPPIAEQRRRRAAAPAPVRPLDEPALSPAQEKLMTVLLCGNEELTPEQLAAVSASDPEIIRQLLAVLEDPNYQYEDSEGNGFAPIHAATLLGRSRSLEAVYPLIQTLYDADEDDIIGSTAITALNELGPVALPAVLESLDCTTDYDFKMSLADVLSTIGRGDDRAFRTLETYFYNTAWDDDREFAVNLLAELGDPRALPILRKALADRDITAGGAREVAFAIAELDPGHDPAELHQLKTKALRRYESKMIRFDKHGRAFCRHCGAPMRKLPNGEWIHTEPAAPDIAALPLAAPVYTGVGRNDLCPCGSGKKFKHCHGSGQMSIN